MRAIIHTLLFFLSLCVFAEQFSVFEKNGYYGIVDKQGQVTVPAVYEQLGWSDGSSSIHHGVVGFRQGKLWGLITVRNKSLTEQKFYTIVPFEDGLVKASLKGKFSNQLFYGLLDNQGKTVVNFRYFTLEPSGAHLLVSNYENQQQRYGVVSVDNTKIIETRYKRIQAVEGWYLAHDKNHTIDLYAGTGEIVQSTLDSAVFQRGWKCFREGYSAYVDLNGNVTYPFTFKNFDIEEGIVFPVSFPKWGVFKNDQLLFEIHADSIYKDENGFWVTYLNGVQHFTLEDSVNVSKDFILMDLSREYLFLKNTKTDKWSMLKYDGTVVLSNYDSLVGFEKGVFALKEQKWSLFNNSGEKQGQMSYNAFLPGIGDQFIVGFNGHWGIIDSHGFQVANYKYDTIAIEGPHYKINYLNRCGAMNTRGTWEVRPEFAQIFIYQHLIIGRLGEGYSVFSDGTMTTKTTSKPVKELDGRLLVKDPDGKMGLLNRYGEFEVYPEYDLIAMVENHIELRKEGYSILMNKNNEVLFNGEEVQSIGGIGDDYILIEKDNRWGFSDGQGRLRISNRYEEAKPFSDGLAAIMLRGRWGFIDKDERIAIQPYYDEVGHFKDGLCTVSKSGAYGLIDLDGKVVLSFDYQKIERQATGNYRVIDQKGKVGLVNSEGIFLLRPIYESLDDIGDERVIIAQNNKYGLLDYKGRQILKADKKEIRISNGYTLVKY
ncbi:MAG: hypothetical protein Tsb0034_17250 [Ekhidna sp.]